MNVHSLEEKEEELKKINFFGIYYAKQVEKMLFECYKRNHY